jgi:Rieske Fe-S protein
MNDCFTSRREVIKQFALGSVTSWLAGSSWTQRLLADVTPLETAGTLTVKVDQFTALRSAGGSVRLSVGLDYPVSINRGFANDFYAVNTDCAHNHCTVEAYNSFLGAMRCACHGSEYDIDGSLISGPAETGLKSYPVTFDGSNLVKVTIPGLTFAARQITVQSINGVSRRLKLVFDSTFFQTYQVTYRATLTDTPTVIPFATTPTGAATQTTYQRTTLAQTEPFPTSLYVDVTGTRGFFSINYVPQVV